MVTITNCLLVITVVCMCFFVSVYYVVPYRHDLLYDLARANVDINIVKDMGS
jgi:hypothetical protein